MREIKMFFNLLFVAFVSHSRCLKIVIRVLQNRNTKLLVLFKVFIETKQECTPVGCVPSTSVAISPTCMPPAMHNPCHTCPLPCHTCPPPPRTTPGMHSPCHAHPLPCNTSPLDTQMPVKILPCPKLCLWVVKSYF